jgi:hypothetical protein
MKKVFVLTLFLSTFCISHSQSITAFNHSIIGISTSRNKPVTFEFLTQLNNGIIDISPELNIFYNFKKKTEDFRFSLGLGVGLNAKLDYQPYILLPFQIELFPVKSFNKFGVVLGLTAGMQADVSEAFLRYMIGIRYSF